MDRFDAMAVLLTVVETGSLSAAGRKLDMPLATVSRNVSDLEARLKAQLLNRSPRRLELTDAGRNYVAACRRILDDVTEAEREAAGEYDAPTGRLVVTAPIVFGRLHVVPVVAAFLEIYPDVDVSMALGDRIVPLLEEHLDCAVRIGELPDSSLVATRVGAIRRVVCASPAYLARMGRPLVPADLAAHRCVSFEAMGSSDAWRFADETVAVRSRLVVNTADAAIEAALAGVGPTRVLSYQVDADVAAGRLETLLPAFEPAPVPVSLVYARPERLPLKLRAFLDFAVPRLRARLRSTPPEGP